MKSPVYNRVAAAAKGQRGYTEVIHGRVDALVQEWIASDAVSKSEEPCGEYVERRYQALYGVPVIGFILWPVISALIQWLVKRTLDELYPEESE